MTTGTIEKWARRAAIVASVCGGAAMVACGSDSANGGSGTDAGGGGGGDSGADARGNGGGVDAGGGDAGGQMMDDGGGTVSEGGGGADTGADAGTPCEQYCNLMATSCSGANAMYGSVAGCVLACEALPVGMSTDTSGDTFGCRAHYAGLAAGDATKCPSAGPFGIDQCESATTPNKACEAFCTIAQAVCDGINKQFADVPTCMGNCQSNTVAGVAITAAAPTSGASFECNAHFLIASMDDKMQCQKIVKGSPPCQ
jgi:hypothetical protein